MANGQLRLGDIIQAIDGDDISELSDLPTVLDRYEPGDAVSVTILRDGDHREVDIRAFRGGVTYPSACSNPDVTTTRSGFPLTAVH